MTASDVRALLYGSAALVAGLVAWRAFSGARAAAQGVANAWPSVNPASPNNLIYRGAGAAIREATGGAAETVGDWLYQAAVKLGIEPDAGKVATTPTPFFMPRASSWRVADQDDADQGAAMRAGVLGVPYYTAADQDDAELGLAMTASAGRPFLNYSHLTARYRR